MLGCKGLKGICTSCRRNWKKSGHNNFLKFCILPFCTKVLLVLATALYSGCYKFMASMAKPTYSSSGNLIDGGMDLNQESGTAEYVLLS